jgi:GT2 family glycosyltransferase/glycosyltransferase involved in cell wall biosynthesis
MTVSASPGAAWQNGLAAAQRGDHKAALLWLERAARIAPHDPRIALDLANTRVSINGPEQLTRAAITFAQLAERYDLVPAWLGLVTVRRLLGEEKAAAEALASLLSRNCVPGDAAFPAIATAIAAGGGFDGWCGMLDSGLIHVEVPPRVKLRVTLDGVETRRPKAAGGFTVPEGRQLAIMTADGGHLAGSPLDLMALRHIEGVASIVDNSLIGWASRPAAPDGAISLTLQDAAGRKTPITFGNPLPPDEHAPFARRLSFAVPGAVLKGFVEPLRVVGPAGANLFGSPLHPAAEAAIKPVPAVFIGPPIKKLPARARLAVVVPVYRGFATTKACLDALLAAAPKGAKIIVVDDAAPEIALATWLDEQAKAGRFTLFRHKENQGFPAAVNTGLAASGGRDVLLLNSDTLVPPGAIEALAAAAYADKSTGSATPFSNEATILNYPKREGKNAAPDLAGATALQALAAEVNAGRTVEIPTGVGFCMFMRHDCLEATGNFRTDLFAQGYGEENDWCFRARDIGFRHVAATGAYVAHLGGVSFRAAGRALNARNARTLNRLYPGYAKLINAHIKADPLAEARFKLDAARFAAARGGTTGGVLLISHNHGGGVARRIEADMQAIRAAGKRPILAFPAAPDDPESTPFPWETQLTDRNLKNGRSEDYPNLRFTLPDDRHRLLALLRAERIEHVVLHHGLGQNASVRNLAADLGVQQDLVLHDYSSFCPRVNLLTKTSKDAPLRYCGEPNVAGCVKCISIAGDETFEGLGPERLIKRSKREFEQARRIITPSADAAARIGRHFEGVRPEVIPWEDDAARVKLKPPGAGNRRIAVIGGIGPAKGYDILMECARDVVRRGLGLEFIVAGATAEDSALMETGRIFVTGAYQEGEATALIRSVEADLSFLPSIWPETWCFALSEAWAAGLYTIAFDLGAPAARIRATGRGALLPLGLPAARINDMLLAWNPASGHPASGHPAPGLPASGLPAAAQVGRR